MKPYGMTKIQYINDSKKVGDYKNSNTGNAVYSSVGSRNALRRYKKVARREDKAFILEILGEL